MKTLFFDCIAGTSGDMTLGALVDLGVELDMIREELKKLDISGYKLSASKERRMGISGTRVKVELQDDQPARSFKDIKVLIKESRLSEAIKTLSLKIFTVIAEAEARVHGCGVEEVHFHEIGAVDSIVDIVGAAIAIDSLEVDKILSSPIPLGTGFVDTQHGPMPVPAPATLEILRGAETRSTSIEAELTTPTGAAIVKSLSEGYGPMPSMLITGTGFGVGFKEFKEVPNLLRVITGELAERPQTCTDEKVQILETNIDDMSPQVAGYLMDRLLNDGALDVYFTPVQMKKSRPGLLLTVLTKKEKETALLDIIFSETTTIGIRKSEAERVCLDRESIKVKTTYGVISVKISKKDGLLVNIQPEYEEARAAAERTKRPLQDVIDEAKTRAKEILGQ